MENLLNRAADAVDGALHGAAGAFEKLGAGAMGAAFNPLLKKVVEEALQQIGPDVGEAVSKKMVQKYPVLDKFDDLTDKAKNAADEAVQSQKANILDFVKDASGDLEGSFPKIGTLILRAIRDGCNSSVDALLGLMPACCSCCAPKADEVKEEAFDEVQGMIKGQIKEKIAHPAGLDIPQGLVDQVMKKLDPLLEFDINADVGEPKSKSSAPEPQTMGASA